MPLISRTLPTRLGAEDKLVDLYVFSLTLFQVLNILGGVPIAAEILTARSLAAVPLTARQVLAAIPLLVGVWAAFWRHDGRSVWMWLWVAARFRSLPRHAVSRPMLVVLDDTPDRRWHEVRPALAWPEQSSGHRASPTEAIR